MRRGVLGGMAMLAVAAAVWLGLTAGPHAGAAPVRHTTPRGTVTAFRPIAPARNQALLRALKHLRTQLPLLPRRTRLRSRAPSIALPPGTTCYVAGGGCSEIPCLQYAGSAPAVLALPGVEAVPAPRRQVLRPSTPRRGVPAPSTPRRAVPQPSIPRRPPVTARCSRRAPTPKIVRAAIHVW